MNVLKSVIFNFLSQFFTGAILNFFTSLVIIILWILIGVLSVKIFNRFLLSVFKLKKNDKRTVTIGKLLNSFNKILVWFIVFMIILSELGVDIAPLLASAGVVGVAVGFGAQSVVKDFISGFFLVLERAFYLNDMVEINGFKGEVIAMNLRTTSLKNWLGEIKLINNGDIVDLINFSKTQSMAVLDFTLDYNSNLQKLIKVIPAFLSEMQLKYKVIIEKPIFLGITALSNIGIECKIIAKTVNGKQFEVECDSRYDLLEFLKKNEFHISNLQVVHTLK